MKYKSIVLDLDGTLLNSEGAISPENVKALRECLTNDLDVWVATARPYRLVYGERGVLKELASLEEKGVFYNGAFALNKTSGYIRHYPIPSKVVAALLATVEAIEPDIQVAIQNREEYHSFRFPGPETMNAWGFPACECIKYSKAKNLPCSKIVVWDDTKNLSGLIEQLQKGFSESLNTYITDSHHWIQIMSRAATKEKASLDMLLRHGVSPGEVVVFGDDLPDLGMFNVFGCSVAMGNAEPELKKAAKYITLSNDDHGVCHALKEILRII